MYFHRVLLLLIPALYMVIPLIIESWQSMESPWFLPYLVWFAVIALAFIIERRRRKNV